MKKEVILIPKDKCPLDYIAEMGERTKNAWIYIHENIYDKLIKSDGVSAEYEKTYFELTWEETEEYPKTEILVNYGVEWYSVCNISAEDIAFKDKVDDPEEIFFLKMDE